MPGKHHETRRPWSATEIELLREWYPDIPTQDIAALLGIRVSKVYNKAFKLRLKKSAAFWASDQTTRIQRGQQDPRMMATRFAPGATPWNKGRKGWQAGGRSAETQFATGISPPNTVPVGSLRITNNKGITQLERKIGTQSGSNHLRWRSVHRLVWEAVHGPVPPGHIIVFKSGMKTLVEAEITIDKVDCISRAENVRRNDPGTGNPVMKGLYQLKGAITRQINRITKEQESTA